MFLDYFTYSLYLITTFFAIYLIISKKEFVIKHKKEVMFFMLALLLYTQYRRYISHFFLPSFDLTLEYLPIHFCRISALMTLLYLITRNKYIKGFVFFQAGLGFLSVIFPGGLLFEMTQDWRNLTFVSDHFFLAIMPVFLIFIDSYQVTKKDFLISMVYSIAVPLMVLPIALSTGYNAYYFLDGVFIKDILGDNQVVIMVTMLILLVIYNILMWYIGKWLYIVSLKVKNKETTLMKPFLPWVAFTSLIVIGIVISIIYVRPVPQYLRDISDEYSSRPVSVIEDEVVIYKGVMDDKTTYFIESLRQKDINILSSNGSEMEFYNIADNHAVYVVTEEYSEDYIVIVVWDDSETEAFIYRFTD